MQSWSSKDFTADCAWGALDIANFPGTTVRLTGPTNPISGTSMMVRRCLP